MKETVQIFMVMILVLLATPELIAQCIPDTVNCVDTTGNPGEICPLELPDAQINVLYDETITIIPPSSYPLSGLELAIFHIVIDSVLNLPPGIDYYPNADTLFPDTAYCIQLNGTPGETGVFDLAIYITALVDFNGLPLNYQVVDSTSLSITVTWEVGLSQDQREAFRVIPNAPNPFSESTRLAFYTPTQERVELFVYNILGTLQHHESELAEPGTHNFRFDGSELHAGTYLYRVKVREHYYTGKFMKSK